jgi:hypothetical protein
MCTRFIYSSMGTACDQKIKSHNQVRFKLIFYLFIGQWLCKYHTFCMIMLSYRRSLWPSSYGSWIYNYLCNQCLSPLVLWVRISIRARCTPLCDKVCQWLALDPPVSSTNKTDRHICHDITEILLKVALNTIKQTIHQLHTIIHTVCI